MCTIFGSLIILFNSIFAQSPIIEYDVGLYRFETHTQTMRGTSGSDRLMASMDEAMLRGERRPPKLALLHARSMPSMPPVHINRWKDECVFK